MQLEKASGRWLLFVTADVRPSSLASDTMIKLCKAIFENVQESESFRKETSSLFECEAGQIEQAVVSAAKTEGLAFLRIFSLGFAKWLLHMARNKEWDVLTHAPYCYSTTPRGDPTPTLTCLAFEFRKRAGLRDPLGITRARPAPSGAGDDTSVRAVDRVAKMENLDQKMTTEHELRAEMARRLKDRLGEAGYPPDVLEEIEA